MAREMNEAWFAAGGQVFCIYSDIGVTDLLFQPQPYNLHINFAIEQTKPVSDHTKIFIISDTEKLRVEYKDDALYIIGDTAPMFRHGYNQQFGLFGNKGIINHFILHTLERHGAVTMHACAVAHPTNCKILIGIGASGAGKSVFVANALKNGWELVASEHVIVTKDMRLLKGNQFDNITPKAVSFIETELPKATVYHKKELREPIGSKFLASMGAYGPKNTEDFDLGRGYSIVILNFGNENFKEAAQVTDDDFFLRIMQQTASEKICFPMIFDDQIYSSSNIGGDAQLRTRTVNALFAKADARLLLGGSYDDLERWLKSQYQG